MGWVRGEGIAVMGIGWKDGVVVRRPEGKVQGRFG